MHVFTRGVFSFRTKFIPPFAHNDKQLAHVLAVGAWQYAHGRQEMPADITLEGLLRVTNKKFMNYGGSNKQKERHKFVYENGGYMRVHASLAFRSWRLGETSPQVATALHMTPQQVRITIYRLIKIARKLGYETFDGSAMSATRRKEGFHLEMSEMRLARKAGDRHNI